MDNRRLLVAAVLSLGFLLLWWTLFPPPKPPTPPATGPAATQAEPHAPAPTLPAPGTAPAPPAASGSGAAVAVQPPALPEIRGDKEEKVVLENAMLRAELSSRGAALTSLLVKVPGRAEPVEMLAKRSGESLRPFDLASPDGKAAEADTALFAVSRERAEGGGDAVVFRLRAGSADVEKTFSVRANGLLDYSIRSGGGRFAFYAGPGLRVRATSELANRFDKRLGVWFASGGASVLDSAKASEPVSVPGAGLGWAGLEDTYFLTAMVGHDGLQEVIYRPILLAPGADERTYVVKAFAKEEELSKEDKALPRDFDLLFVAAADTISGASYWGTKQYDRLVSTGFGLEKSVNWGTFGFLARPLLVALQWIHDHLVSNYGWAIVLLTTLLKLALLPLSITSFRSMRKMQALNPRMQAIRERYRPKLRDKNGRFVPGMQQQMNEEVMALYKAEGVNPMGGCLPILIQLPVFFGFYTLLSTTVELWHVPWLWVPDLTQPEPFPLLLRPLPLIMGVTQVLQQRMTPPPPDPMQRRMMQLLPVIWTFFSLNFPAGLVLYWLTNNVLSIGQQAIYNRFHPTAQAIAKTTSTERGRRSGGR